MKKKVSLVIITGMSGAGKTVAMQTFEDMGYFCMDNIPPKLIIKCLEMIEKSGSRSKIALKLDLRLGILFKEVKKSILHLENTSNIDFQILFLDALENQIVSRYKETRRLHPLNINGLITEKIKKERELLQVLRTKSSIFIDTTKLSPRELRKKIHTMFPFQSMLSFSIEIISFGFKYGLPIESDIVMDVRFLPNPYYIDKLKSCTGLDKPVQDFLMSFEETKEFYEKFSSLLVNTIPRYVQEGKSKLIISIGCTGGQHRSVFLVEKLAILLEKNYNLNIIHRDKDNRKETVNRS